MLKNAPSLDPSTVSIENSRMAAEWEKIESLLGGTEAMRAAGTKFLPQHDQESSSNYNNRLRVTTLRNMTQMVLDAWVGQPFSEKVKVSDDTPEKVREVLDDVDLRGNDVTVFAREWFREGLAKAWAHALIEFPSADGVETLADERAQSLRPYWCFLKPENVIFVVREARGGKEFLTHVRIRERDVEREGFAEKITHRIRVYDRVEFPEGPKIFVSAWEWRVDARGKKGDWVQTMAPLPIGIDVIPLVTFWADRDRSPLSDVADLNVSHWQSTSDQRAVLTVARFPMLAASGASEDESRVNIGPKQLLYTRDPSGRFYYVEHSGSAIAAGRQDLSDLEEQMASYGAEFLRRKPGNQTATAAQIESCEATSRLQDAVVRFNDVLAQAMWITKKWLKEEESPGSISVGTDFAPAVDQGDLQALADGRKLRDLSRATYLRALKDRGVLPRDFDPEENDRDLEAEASMFSGEPVSGDIRTEG